MRRTGGVSHDMGRVVKGNLKKSFRPHLEGERNAYPAFAAVRLAASRDGSTYSPRRRNFS